MARNKGIAPFSGNFEPQIAAPLDARVVVDNKSDLTLSTTWQAHDGSVYVYKGMLVVVANDADTNNNGVYYLKDEDYTQENNWIKVSGGAGAGNGWIDDGEVVRLETSTDRIGIGTTTPEAKVHMVDDGTNVNSLRLSGATARIELDNTNKPVGGQCVDFASYETDTPGDWAWWFRLLDNNYTVVQGIYFKFKDNEIEVNADRGWGLGRSNIGFKVHSALQENTLVVDGTEGYVSIGSDNAPDDAILYVESVNRGVVISSMTTQQRLNIMTQTNGLLVFDTDLQQFCYYSNGEWYNLSSSDFIVCQIDEPLEDGTLVKSLSLDDTTLNYVKATKVNHILDIPVGIVEQNITQPGYYKVRIKGIRQAPQYLIDEINLYTITSKNYYPKLYYDKNGKITFRKVSDEIGVYLGEYSGVYYIYINTVNIKQIQPKRINLFSFSIKITPEMANNGQAIYTRILSFATKYRYLIEAFTNILHWEFKYENSTNPNPPTEYKQFNDYTELVAYLDSLNGLYLQVTVFLLAYNQKGEFIKFNTGLSQVKSRFLKIYSKQCKSLYSIQQNNGWNGIADKLQKYIYQTFCNVNPNTLPEDAGKAIIMHYTPSTMYNRNAEMLRYTMIEYVYNPTYKGLYDKNTNTIVSLQNKQMILYDYKYVAIPPSQNDTIQDYYEALLYNDTYNSRIAIYCYVDNVLNPRYYLFSLKAIDNDTIVLRNHPSLIKNGTIYAVVKFRKNRKKMIYYLADETLNQNKVMYNYYYRITKSGLNPQVIETLKKKMNKDNNAIIDFIVYDNDTGLIAEYVNVVEFLKKRYGLYNCLV